MLRYLLDTNIVIYVLKRRPVGVLEVFNQNASRMAISAITLSELFHGAEKISKASKNLAVIEDFCSRLEVLAYGDKAAQQSVRGWRILASMTCISSPTRAGSEGLVMVTNNVEEFAQVPALQVEKWVSNRQ